MYGKQIKKERRQNKLQKFIGGLILLVILAGYLPIFTNEYAPLSDEQLRIQEDISSTYEGDVNYKG